MWHPSTVMKLDSRMRIPCEPPITSRPRSSRYSESSMLMTFWFASGRVMIGTSPSLATMTMGMASVATRLIVKSWLMLYVPP